MIQPNARTILDILQSVHRYEVPRYQREYTWGKTEAEDFLEDLLSSSLKAQESLFLGNFIFDVSEIGSSKIRIVDGQQRITTIMLLLIACRNVAKNLGDEPIARSIQQMITFTDVASAQSKGTRLIPSESVKDVFEKISEYEWAGELPTKIGTKQVKRQSNRIRPIYSFFFNEITKLDREALINFQRSIYNTYVFTIEIKNEIEAFKIFERTNARGVDLEASDLLKNYLFSEGVVGLEEGWKQIMENSDGTVLRMLKYFYVSKKGYILKSDLYDELKKYSKEISPSIFYIELDKFANFYGNIRNADVNGIKNYFESIGLSSISSDVDKFEKVYYSVEGLRLFKVAQAYPLIYSAIECIVRGGLQKDVETAKRLIALFQALEKYHFINNAVCERIGNEVEKLYADFCKKFAASENFELTYKELIGKLVEQLAKEDEFVSRFVEITYGVSTIPLISYIFDRINNFDLRPTSRVRIYYPDQRILRRNHNIEHFFPQNPDTSNLASPETQEVVDNIGNLLAISFLTNSKLGNLTPQKKLEKLAGPLQAEIQNLVYVREFLQKYSESALHWDKNVILERASDIAITSYEKVWKIA